MTDTFSGEKIWSKKDSLLAEINNVLSLAEKHRNTEGKRAVRLK